MGSVNKTANYNLNQWQGNEYPKREDFVEDNLKIDQALNPTADSSQVPTGLVGTRTQWVSWITNRIIAITGKTNWYDVPDTTLATAKTHIDATTGVHGAVSAGTANKIIIRDSAGHAQVANPSAAQDIATKNYVDTTAILKSLATGENDFLVASGVGVWAKKTVAEVKTLLDFTTADVGAVNPTLLINWDFRNPINQRGLTIYATSGGYSIDRWKINGTLNVNAGYITFTGYFTQLIENYSKHLGTYTASFKVKTAFSGNANFYMYGGGGYIAQKNIASAEAGEIIALTFTINSPLSTNFSFNIYSETELQIEAVKLEKGTVSTISAELLANFGEQLAFCQRYFLSQEDAVQYSGYAMQATAATTLNGSIPFPVPMRITPTLLMPVTLRSNTTGAVVTVTALNAQVGKTGINSIWSIVGGTLDVGSWYSVKFTADAEIY